MSLRDQINKILYPNLRPSLWIAADRSLPDGPEEVVVCVKDANGRRHRALGRCRKGVWTRNPYISGDVTHWMRAGLP